MSGIEDCLKGAELLIIAPHADDEALGCGGIIHQARERGDRVRVLFGTIGGYAAKSGGSDSTTKDREAELAEAMRRTGISEYLAWDPAGKHHLRLDSVPVTELVNWIEHSKYGLLERGADVVLIPSAQHSHQDHQAMHRASVAAIRTSLKLRSLAVLEYEIPGTGQAGCDAFDPDIYVEMTERDLHAKIAHFEAYASQVASMPHLRSVHAIRTLASYRGLEGGYEHAEAYKLLRLKIATPRAIRPGEIAKALYLEEGRGLDDVRARLATNTAQGTFDLRATVASWLSPANGERVLDVGCGTGDHVASLAAEHGIAPYGVDIAPDRCRRSPTIRFAIASADRLPFPAGQFDKVMCNYALYYVDDWNGAVEEMLRVTVPSGRILITGPAIDNNAQLYELHRQAFGEISEIDRVAHGFLERHVEPLLSQRGITYDVATYDNKVTFGKPEQLIRHYQTTSLWRCTAAECGQAAISAIENLVNAHFKKEQIFTNTKRVRFVRIAR